MRSRIATIGAAVALVGSVQAAFGMEVPSNSRFAHEIKSVKYNGQNVTPLDAVVGIETTIILQKGEVVETHAFGDGKAWDFASYKNDVFIKPSAQDGSTDLTIITNKRTYVFQLHYIANHRSSLATYELRFRYDLSRGKILAAIDKKIVRYNLKHANEGAKFNLDYAMSGNMAIAPENVWDDGQFTYFKFPAKIPLPVLFHWGPKKQESIVNVRVEGAANNILVAPGIARRWILRSGMQVLGIWNRYYSRDGYSNKTGTASPNVKRVVVVTSQDSVK